MPATGRSPRARVAAPSSADPAAKVATDAIAMQLRALTVEHDKAAAGDVEAVHRLRVATRRLRAALRMLREVAPGDEAATAADELAWLCGAIGAVRDLDVLAQLLENRAARLESDFIHALEPLSETIRHNRVVEQERLTEALDSERYSGLVRRLGAITPEPAADGPTLGAMAARLVRPQVRALLRAGAGLDEASAPNAFHRLRVRAKKLRYTLEPLRAVGGKALRKMLRQLERIQERVGMYHDAVTAGTWLREWATESHEAPVMTMLASGALIYSVDRRARRLRLRGLKSWCRTDMDEIARAALGELTQAAAKARRAAKPPLTLVPAVRAL